MNQIEIRFGRTKNGSENGLYQCFPEDIKIRDIMIEPYKYVYEATKNDTWGPYSHWKGFTTCQLWKDWKRDRFFGDMKIFLDEQDLNLTLRELADSIAEETPPIRSSVIVEVPVNKNGNHNH